MPKSLEKEGGYEHQLAAFGVVPHTGSMRGQVMYTTLDFCSRTKSISASQLFPVDDNNKYVVSPLVLMINRGDEKCSVATKVLNAQRFGADSVIIANNKEESDGLPVSWHCLLNSERVVTQRENFVLTRRLPINPLCSCSNYNGTFQIMYYDSPGSGIYFGINIPAFLITKKDSDVIKALMQQKNQIVRVQVDFGVADPTERVVDYKFWFQPGEENAFRFVTEFKDIVVAFGDRVSFTPFFPISYGATNGCRDEAPSSSSGGSYDAYGNPRPLKVPNSDCSPSFSCTNSGRYCVFESDLFPFVSGADIVTESLRRLCIWDQHQIGLKWWDYIREFALQCHGDIDNLAAFSSKECVNKVLDQVGIDGSKIDLCMQYNGGLAGDTVNTMLEQQVALRPGFVPYSMIDNRYFLYDATNPEHVFKSICGKFPTEDQPLA